MKNLLIILFFLCSGLSFGQVTDAALTTQSNVIRDETTAGANTKTRIAAMYQAIIDSKISKVDTQTANTVFAGPTTGSAASPGFRALVLADLAALSGTSGYVLTSNGAGVAPSWQAASGSGWATSGTTSVTNPVISGTPTFDNLVTIGGNAAFTAKNAGLYIGGWSPNLVRAITVQRHIDADGTGPAYAFWDNSIMVRGGSTGYASIDLQPSFGTANSFVDYVALQCRPAINTSSPSVLSDMYALYWEPALTGGKITRTYAGFARNITVGSGGSVDNQYGFYTENLTSGGVSNYAFYAAGTTPSYFGGSTTIGGTNSWNFNPSTAIAALNIQSGGTSGSVDIKYNGTLYQGMRLDGMTSEARWYAVTGYSSVLYANGAEALRITTLAKLVQPSTETAGGTTGNQTINKPTGSVNIAAAGTTVTVTNSLCTTSSHVFAMVETNDATAYVKNVVKGSGSFVINLGAAATAEVRISFWVIN